MLIIDKPMTSSLPLSDRLRHVLNLRCDLIDIAAFVIVNEGDTKQDIEAATGFPIANDYPPWEWVLDHGGVFEAPIVTSDSGACTVLIVPDEEGIDAELLCLLRDQAESALSSDS